MAVLSGTLNLPFYETDPERYRAIRWMPRGWAWVDPAKEVQAYKDAVRCGFKTLGEVVAEQGGDLEELLVARAAEVQMAEELDLYFDTDPSEVNAAGTQQPGEAPEAPEPDDSEDDPASDNGEDDTENTDGPIA
jgi:capsid protein